MQTQYYSNPNFERAIDKRLLLDPVITDDLLIYTMDGKFLFNNLDDSPTLLTVPLAANNDKTTSKIFLGHYLGKNTWLATLSPENDTKGATLVSVRKLIHKLDQETLSLLAFAQGISTWNRETKFCSVCGSTTIVEEQGHVRKCSAKGCETLFYPKISPAIIALVVYKPIGEAEQCLLHVFPREPMSLCTTFAGFVEIGERIEDAVVRELKEEVNVDVIDLTYKDSQPWVFSSSLMLGFRAEVANKDFKVDGEEILDAAWFTAKELQQLVADHKMVLSKEDSIARTLITSWIAENV